MTRVVISASQALIRGGIEALLSGAPEIQVTGSRSRLEDALDLARETAADVLVLAIDAKDDETPLESFAIAGDAESPALVLLSAEEQLAWTLQALRAGVRAVLPQQISTAELAAALIAAAAGLTVLRPRDLEAVAVPSLQPAHESGPLEQQLTAREMEVLNMLASGLGNKEIAWRLSISDHTAKFHVASILAKLGASTRTEAVTTAIRRGLVYL